MFSKVKPTVLSSCRYLAPFSFLANCAQALGLVMIFAFFFAVDESTGQRFPSVQDRDWVAPMNKLPLFFGTAIFAIEGICIVSLYSSHWCNPHKTFIYP